MDYAELVDPTTDSNGKPFDESKVERAALLLVDLHPLLAHDSARSIVVNAGRPAITSQSETIEVLREALILARAAAVNFCVRLEIHEIEQIDAALAKVSPTVIDEALAFTERQLADAIKPTLRGCFEPWRKDHFESWLDSVAMQLARDARAAMGEAA